MKRQVYLSMKTLEEAKELFSSRFGRDKRTDIETINIEDALGRIIVEPVFAKRSCPSFHSAAMDGIAVKAENTFGVSETRPKKLAVGKDAFYVNTGHVLPENTDAVIMIEYINVLGDDFIEIEAPVFPWQNVRKMGEDIVATELIFPRNHLVTPYCVGALISGGIFSSKTRALSSSNSFLANSKVSFISSILS